MDASAASSVASLSSAAATSQRTGGSGASNSHRTSEGAVACLDAYDDSGGGGSSGPLRQPWSRSTRSAPQPHDSDLVQARNQALEPVAAGPPVTGKVLLQGPHAAVARPHAQKVVVAAAKDVRGVAGLDRAHGVAPAAAHGAAADEVGHRQRRQHRQQQLRRQQLNGEHVGVCVLRRRRRRRRRRAEFQPGTAHHVGEPGSDVGRHGELRVG